MPTPDNVKIAAALKNTKTATRGIGGDDQLPTSIIKIPANSIPPMTE
jgi:hypothetical protein